MQKLSDSNPKSNFNSVEFAEPFIQLERAAWFVVLLTSRMPLNYNIPVNISDRMQAGGFYLALKICHKFIHEIEQHSH